MLFGGVERRVRGPATSALDGVTVQYDDWWFNVRTSNTEDLFRLNLEADTKDEALYTWNTRPTAGGRLIN